MKTEKRWLALWFPQWSIQCLRHEHPGLRQQPVVIYGNAPRGGQRVVQCSPQAAEGGIRPGMPLAEARSLHRKPPTPSAEQTRIYWAAENLPACLQRLQALADWAQRYSPLVAVEEAAAAECLLVDITGLTHLWGPEEVLAREIFLRLQAQGWHAALGIADTAGAAWALAHANQPVWVAPPGQTAQALGPVPVQWLRLPEPVVDLLQQLGVKQVAGLLALPTASLAGRFPEILLQRLHQALGHQPELLQPHRVLQAPCWRWDFEIPVRDRAALAAVLQSCLERLTQNLALRGHQARKLVCNLQPERGLAARAELELFQPSGCLRHWWDVLQLRLERLTLPAALQAVELRFEGLVPCTQRQPLLPGFASPLESGHWIRLVDRLTQRLGESAVLRPRLMPDAQPEHACRYFPWLKSKSSQSQPKKDSQAVVRPLWLAGRPIPARVVEQNAAGLPCRVVLHGREEQLIDCQGPERIETGWWRKPPIQRDYYRVRTQTGLRWWLFCRLKDRQWFLQGWLD